MRLSICHLQVSHVKCEKTVKDEVELATWRGIGPGQGPRSKLNFATTSQGSPPLRQPKVRNPSISFLHARMNNAEKSQIERMWLHQTTAESVLPLAC